ncbi:hypothetical protein FO519_004204 [Halicephalobus sp. NKZ332]|nr:hypothetical protein FO519_004204 [Halicephalobus sp. NKZ332]
MGDGNRLVENDSATPLSVIGGSIAVCQVEVPCSSEVNENENNQYTKEVGVNPCLSTGRTTFINCNPDITCQITQRNTPIRRLDSVGSSSYYYSEYPERCWPDDPAACSHFYSLLTSMYALVAIVFSIVIELSQKFTPEEWFAETMFYTYMYGVGLAFLLYCYLFMIHPTWYNMLLRFGHDKGWLGNYKQKMIIPTSHTGEGAGSLYLRLGTLFFGSIGIVLFGLETFMCHSDYNCQTYQLVNLFFAGLFTFVQMHFLFCNSRIVIVGSKNLAKLGTMHLLAVNVWTWLRFVLAKHSAKANKNVDDDSIYTALMSMDAPDPMDSNLTITINAAAMRRSTSKVTSFHYFGDFATFLTTCIIEYSVIGAAIMFVMWRSIDETSEDLTVRKKKKSKVRIDCSSSSGGLFAGVLFLIFSFVSIGIYSYFYQLSDSEGATLVFRLSDMLLFCFALIGCIIGLYKMRVLQYTRGHSTNAEFLDELLLFIGLLGELIHCSTGLICWVTTQAEERDRMETYMLFVLATRIIQVILQSLFILLSSRLRCLSTLASENKPGKQFVTFLLIANVSLFFFHTLEGMKSVFGDAVFSERTKPYTILISAVAPLTVFYRFHSSVCLAEIWKHCYSVKNVVGLGSPSSSDSGDESKTYSSCLSGRQGTNCHSYGRHVEDLNVSSRTNLPSLPLTLPRRRTGAEQ